MKINSVSALVAAAVVLGGASVGFGNIVVTVTSNASSTALTSSAGYTYGVGSFQGFSWQSITLTEELGTASSEFAMTIAGLQNTNSGAASISFSGVDNNFVLPAGTSAQLILSNGTISSYANSGGTVSVTGSIQDVSPAGGLVSNPVITSQSLGNGLLYKDSAENGILVSGNNITGQLALGNAIVLNNLSNNQTINEVLGATSLTPSTVPTPEPMSLALMGLGALPLLLLRRRAKA